MERDPVDVARTMVRGGRGILAADESISTMDSRLEKAGVEPGEDRRRAYREMLVTTADLSTWISGVILSDDIARATTHAGPSFMQACATMIYQLLECFGVGFDHFALFETVKNVRANIGRAANRRKGQGNRGTDGR